MHPKETRLAAIRLRHEGVKVKQISEELGVPPRTISDWTKDHRHLVHDSEIRKVVVLPDPHVPFEDKRADRAILSYLRDEIWDDWVCLGDLLDFDFLFGVGKRDLGKIPRSTFQYQFDTGGEYLDRHQEACRWRNPDCRMHLIEGNHDVRIENFINHYPSHKGDLEVPNQLDLEGRGIEWYPYWSDKRVRLDIGKATFIHGLSVSAYHSRQHALRYVGRNLFYGHTHDVQCTSWQGDGPNDTWVSQSLGTLSSYDLDYKRGIPDRWQQAFAVFWFHPSGLFQYSVVRIFNGEFVAPNGKLYRG